MIEGDIWSQPLASKQAGTLCTLSGTHTSNIHTTCTYTKWVTEEETVAIANIFLQCCLGWLHSDLVIFQMPTPYEGLIYILWGFNLRVLLFSIYNFPVRNCLSLSNYEKLNVINKISIHKKNHKKFMLCLKYEHT